MATGEGGEDGAEGCDKRRRKGGQSRKRGKWKMHFFFSLSLVHMRAQLCLRIISFPNLFYPMEIRHPSVNMYVYVHVCAYVYTLRAYRSEERRVRERV